MKKERRFRNSLLSLLLIFSLWPLSLLSQERFRRTPPIPEPMPALNLPRIQSTSLLNGLEVSFIVQDHLPIVSLNIVIFSGESSSPERLQSLATLTARTLSQGTSFLSSSQIEEKIEFMGGSFSTATYADFTLLSLTVLEGYLDQALDLLSGMVLQPVFPKREIESEKRALYFELLEQNRNPEFLARRQLLRLLFQNHHYDKTNFNEDVIKNLIQKDLISFHHEHYRPNNAHLILSGRFDIERTSRRILYYFGRWIRKERQTASLPPPKPFSQKKICLVDLPQAGDATIFLGNIISPPSSPDISSLLVMNQILGGTTNDRLFMNLRESKGYAYYAFSEILFYKACSVFLIKARVRPDVVFASLQEILKEMELVSTQKIPSFETEQAKSYLIGHFPLRIETSESLTFKLAEIKAFDLGDAHWSRYHENIMTLTPDAVLQAARKYPLLTPAVVIVGDASIILNQFRSAEEVEVFNIKGISLGIHRFR